MAVFLGVGGEMDLKFRCCQAAALSFFYFETRAGGEGFQRVNNTGRGGSGVDQRADGHVAADAGEGVEVADHNLL